MTRKASLHTQVSSHAVSLAEMFRVAMLKNRVGAYRPEMTAPEESTAGGALALQHIRLLPPEEGGHVIVVGNANVSTQTAELRTFEYIESVSQERWKTGSGLDRAAYDAFLDQAQAVLTVYSLKVVRVGPPLAAPPDEPTESTPPPKASRSVALAIGVSVLLVAAVVSVFAFAR